MMDRKGLLLIVLMMIISSVLVSAYPLSTESTRIITRKDIRLSIVNQEPDPVEPGQYVKLRVKVENWGSDSTAPIAVGIKPTYPFTLLDGYEAEQQISGLERRQNEGDGEILEWKLRVDKDAAEGDNEIIIYYKELTGQMIEVSSEEQFYIEVRTSDTILQVMDITTEPEDVVPGQVSELKIKIKNLGDSFIKDVVVMLNMSDIDMATIGSIREQIIPMVDGGEEIEVLFDILPSPSIGLEALKIPITLKFKDNLNTEYSQAGTFGLMINSPIEYVLGLDNSEIKTKGGNGDVSVKISNPGLNNIKLLTMELKPSPQYEILSSSKIYVGNVDSDDFETVTYKLHVNNEEDKDDEGQEKDVMLRLLLTYKDDYNNEFNIEEELQLPTFSSGDAKKYGLVQSKGNGGTIFFIIIIVGGGAWYYFYRKKKKKKKLESKSK